MDLERLKVFYLKNKVIFPQCTLHFFLNKTVWSESLKGGDKIIAWPMRSFFDIVFYKKRVGTIAQILSSSDESGRIKLQLKGVSRIRIKKFFTLNLVSWEPIAEKNGAERDDVINELRKTAQELIFLINVQESDRLISLLGLLVDAGQMSDFIANYFVIDYKKRYLLLKEGDPYKRAERLIVLLRELIDKMKRGLGAAK